VSCMLALIFLWAFLNGLLVEKSYAADSATAILKTVLETKDPSKKMELLDEALQTEGLTGKTMASLYFQRALALKELKDYFRALEDLDAAITQYKRMPGIMLEKAECLIMVDQLDQASLALENFLLTRPGTARAYTLKGIIYEKEGSLLKAEDEYTRALRYEPEYAPAIKERANVYLKEGKPRKAVDDFDMLVKLEPDNSDALIARAGVHCKLSDFSAALADYARADTLKPNDHRIRRERVLIYIKLNKPQKALEILSRYQGRSDDVESLVLTARSYILSSDFKKAEAILDQVEIGWPNNAEGKLLYGVINSRRQQFDKALAGLNSALELDPKLVEAYKERAKVFVALNEPVRAVNDLTSAAEVDPADGEIFALRGETQYLRKMYDAAKSDFSRAVETLGNDPRILYDRSLVQLKKEDFQGALQDLDMVCRLRPDSGRALSMRGVTRFFLGDHELAISDLEKSCALDPKDPVVLNNRGFFYLKLGNYPAAKSDFEKVLTIDPSFKDARQNLKLVAYRELQETLSVKDAGSTWGQ
jgi:tetratricopeptide (TPR) repeat protein